MGTTPIGHVEGVKWLQGVGRRLGDCESAECALDGFIRLALQCWL